MSAPNSTLDDRAAAMRQAFDRVFAEPARFEQPETVDFLSIRTEAQSYALALTDIGGLFARKRITRIRASLPTLIGIAGFRGAIAPVYDLSMLLGHGRTERPEWLITAAAAPIALAFGGFGGHLRVPRGALIAGDAGEGQLIRAHVETGGTITPIVHLSELLKAIARHQPDGHVGEDMGHV